MRVGPAHLSDPGQVPASSISASHLCPVAWYPHPHPHPKFFHGMTGQGPGVRQAEGVVVLGLGFPREVCVNDGAVGTGPPKRTRMGKSV